MELQPLPYKQLVSQIGDLLAIGREKAAVQVNTILVHTYWEIGRYIVEFEQKGNEKAEYGSQLFERLSKDLTTAYGKGFTAQIFPICGLCICDFKNVRHCLTN